MSRINRFILLLPLVALSVWACGSIAEQFGFGEEASGTILAEPELTELDSGKTLERIAFGSCADQNLGQSIWNTIDASDPDVFLFMGDNVYGDVSSPDLRELITAYNGLASSRPFTQFAEDVPVLAVWDDHDFGRNDGGADFEYRTQSEQVFLDFWGVEKDDARRLREGIYHARIVGGSGRRVQIILLDTRSFRSPLKETDQRGAPGKERYVPDDAPSKTMLGAAQWDWLEEELKKTADLRLIVSSIQVIAEGHGWERWGNFPRERERLFELINRTNANGVILLSGDRHLGGFYKYEQGLNYPLYEVTSSSLNKPLSSFVSGGQSEPGPHRLYDTFMDANFGLLEIDWDGRAIVLRLNDQSGKTVQKEELKLEDLQ